MEESLIWILGRHMRRLGPASVKLSFHFQVGIKLWDGCYGWSSLRFILAEKVFSVTLRVWSSPSGCTVCRFLLSAPVDGVRYSIFGLCTAVYFGRWNCKIPPDAFVFYKESIPFIIRYVFETSNPSLHPRV